MADIPLVKSPADHIELSKQASAPTTPVTGRGRLYVKTDGLYFVDDAGNELGPFIHAD
jgi:hypothetical protein